MQYRSLIFAYWGKGIVMNSSDQEKARLGAETLGSFFSQFGPPDVYTQILLEVLFEMLLEPTKSQAATQVNYPYPKG